MVLAMMPEIYQTLAADRLAGLVRQPDREREEAVRPAARAETQEAAAELLDLIRAPPAAPRQTIDEQAVDQFLAQAKRDFGRPGLAEKPDILQEKKEKQETTDQLVTLARQSLGRFALDAQQFAETQQSAEKQRAAEAARADLRLHHFLRCRILFPILKGLSYQACS